VCPDKPLAAALRHVGRSKNFVGIVPTVGYEQQCARGVTQEVGQGIIYGAVELEADPAKFEVESATNEMHKWVAPDEP
jgi:hypothetical protein